MEKQNLLFSESDMRSRKSANESQMYDAVKELAIDIVNVRSP